MNNKIYPIRQDYPFMRLPIDDDDWEKVTGLKYTNQLLNEVVEEWNKHNSDSDKQLVQCKYCHRFSFWGGYEDNPSMWQCEECGDIFCFECCVIVNEIDDRILCTECLDREIERRK